MAIRQVKFNMSELAKRAAESVGFSNDQCVNVERLPDGMFNKAFLFTMHDGTKVVGKVPNPNAGRPHYTTASEVATMDFVRNKLSTPVPKVLAWSSQANKNPVGAEYIIMEKVGGVQLDKRFELVKTISGHQRAWMSKSFTQYGSLYYSKDLHSSRGCIFMDEDGSQFEDDRFAIGPSTGRGFLDDGRIDVDFDGGPWDNLYDYKLAVGFRELACVQDMPQLPRSLLGLYGPGTYRRSRSKKIAAIRDYLRMVHFFLPTDDSISSAFLWHRDLHIENIFVNPKDPSEVVGIIDWQSSEVLPLLDHARQPYFHDYNGPPATGLDPPEFPRDFDQLDADEKIKAERLYLNMSLATLYRKLTYGKNKRLFKAMEFQKPSSFDMMLFAQNLLIDGEALYRARLLELEEEWPCLPGVQASGNPPFPLQYTTGEVNSIHEDADKASRSMELMKGVKECLGELWPAKGIVPPERYDEVRELLKHVKTDLTDQLANSEEERIGWVKAWPFDD
ncbi:aminoglycoside phosphotransferase family protein [Aspergillus vadensis CBS 113365]|uniref:Altered inheritance of mitochondria protein 9, mitochondrial n=1 Tax=Aspergillus vadensis (strain CBS 113365 / IMI 142717 / IBT 24658) TaxID=1448311 RepID=A0A319C3F1_ASPVC|nr:phosphotransferase enzyme family protein [Aspergillus vadensis CBS 113365]PYH72743.1 phosphotransferase enzyme family protein [Aspergillus vadensis CBS 113365]